jgi:hypothetical protein
MLSGCGIQVHSDGPRLGAAFTLRLPLQPSPADSSQHKNPPQTRLPRAWQETCEQAQSTCVCIAILFSLPPAKAAGLCLGLSC